MSVHHYVKLFYGMTVTENMVQVPKPELPEACADCGRDFKDEKYCPQCGCKRDPLEPQECIDDSMPFDLKCSGKYGCKYVSEDDNCWALEPGVIGHIIVRRLTREISDDEEDIGLLVDVMKVTNRANDKDRERLLSFAKEMGLKLSEKPEIKWWLVLGEC